MVYINIFLSLFLILKKDPCVLSITEWQKVSLKSLQNDSVKYNDSRVRKLIDQSKAELREQYEDRNYFIDQIVNKDSCLLSNCSFLIVESKFSGEQEVSCIDLFISKERINRHIFYRLNQNTWEKIKEETCIKYDQTIESLTHIRPSYNTNTSVIFGASIVITYYNYKNMNSNVFFNPTKDEFEKILALSQIR
jgi:hypothetical protein